MTVGRRVVGIALVCALAIGALAAACASAAPTGYTAFTCANVGGTAGHFTKAHCRKEDAGSGAFKHVGFSGSAAVTGTNSSTAGGTTTAAPTILKGTTLAGTKITIQCNTVSATGTLENSAVGEAMSVGGAIKITYGECVVIEPENRGCVISGAHVIETEELEVVSKEMNLELRPKTKNLMIASITIERCLNQEPPDSTYPLRGTLTIPEVEPQGTTLTTTEAGVTAAKTLKFDLGTAGLESAMTLKGPSGAGLSFTTPPYTE